MPAERGAPALVAGLDPLPGQCGLVGLAGQPLPLEAVDSRRTFGRLWRPLLESTALDALHARSDEPTPGRRARRFVERLSFAPVGVNGAASAGRSLVARSTYVDLRALVWHDRAAHAVALNPRHELVSA